MLPVDQSTPHASHLSAATPIAETPRGSLYSPSFDEYSMGESSTSPNSRSSSGAQSIGTPTLNKLNSFLDSRDISPVRYPAVVPLAQASGRTRRRHVRKARQAVGAVLEEIAPHESRVLWKALVSSKSLEQPAESTDTENKDDEDVDDALMDAIAECYQNAPTWQVRRQVLSIVADKMCLRTLRGWIPNLTRYRFRAAREHALKLGRGIPLTKETSRRMYVSQTQVDHFLDFITSPHIIQDLPFGEKVIHLTTGDSIKVPNVVRLMIPETAVQQYISYATECNFIPLSRRSLLNILSVCSASVRRSLQGLDYISSSGAEAFDDLCGIVDRLGDEGMGFSWAKEQKDHLNAAKRYLKSDFKVRLRDIVTIK